MQNSNSIYPIPFADFQRICSVIYAVLKSEKADLRKSCVFINIVASSILKMHYGISAHVCAGAALYRVTDAGDTLSLCHEDFVSSSESAFHCWLDTGEWIIDFTSPLYSEMLKLGGCDNSCDSKMFQRRHATISRHPNDLKQAGDCCLILNMELTKKVVSDFIAIQGYRDLLEIIVKHYKKPPKDMIELVIGGSNGTVNHIKPLNVSLVGSW